MTVQWTVLRNRRFEYGIYPAGRPAPGGWTPLDATGSEEECRRWLEESVLADGLAQGSAP